MRCDHGLATAICTFLLPLGSRLKGRANNQAGEVADNNSAGGKKASKRRRGKKAAKGRRKRVVRQES